MIAERALLALALALVAAPATAAAPPPSFSAEQVEEGGKLYSAACASCHGANLEGGTGPGLVVPAFQSGYRNKPVRALYSRIISTMPASQPGSLSEAQVLKLTALIFARNGLPVGDAPVTSPAELSAFRFPEAPSWSAAP